MFSMRCKRENREKHMLSVGSLLLRTGEPSSVKGVQSPELRPLQSGVEYLLSLKSAPSKWLPSVSQSPSNNMIGALWRVMWTDDINHPIIGRSSDSLASLVTWVSLVCAVWSAVVKAVGDLFKPSVFFSADCTCWISHEQIGPTAFFGWQSAVGIVCQCL